MIQGSSYVDILHQAPINSSLLEWKTYDLPRKLLVLSSAEIQELSPSLWTSTVAPRWKACLREQILKTRIVGEPEEWGEKIDDVSDKALDDLCTAFIELFNGVLFLRVTSHQATELVRETIDACAKTLLGSLKVTECSSNDTRHSEGPYGSDTRKVEGTLKNAVKTTTKSYGSTHDSEQSNVDITLSSTQISSAVLDALRWTMEYAIDLLEQMSRYSVGHSQSTPYPPAHSMNSSVSARTIHQVRAFDTPRYQQRVLLLLDTIEKSGLLTRVDIIGNIPCSQLDYVGYCKTRDQLPLMKFFVRLRTKEVFTLPVFNLESENPLGYAKLHVCLQAFVCNQLDYKSCGCWKKESNDTYTRPLHCSAVTSLVHHVQHTIADFHLCINRVVMIVLLYMEQYLFVLRHSFLDALLVIACRNIIVNCIGFLLEHIEGGATQGKLSARTYSAEGSLLVTEYPYPPSHNLYHLCAYLHMEGVMALDDIWNLIGPPESFIADLLAVATQRYVAQPKPAENTNTCHVDKYKYMDIVPSTLSPNNALSLLTTLIIAFLNMNAWSCAMSLLKHLLRVCPLWSLHLSTGILEAVGFLLCWTLQQWITQEQFVEEVPENSESSLKQEDNPTRNSAIGAYSSPYTYGLNARKGIHGLKPVTGEDVFRSQCIPVLELLGASLGQLPLYVLEYVVKATTLSLLTLRTRHQKDEQPFAISECYAHLYSHVIFPALLLSKPTVMITGKIWEGLQLLSIQQRYAIYAEFYYNVKRQCPLLVLCSQSVRRIIGRELKRVTAEQSDSHVSPILFNATCGGLSVMGDIVVKQKVRVTHNDRTVMDSLLKLCCTNPFEVLDVILHHVELFDSMLIQVIINYLPSLPDLCCDIAVFLVTERQYCSDALDQGAWSPCAPAPKRWRNIAHFIARFMRRFQAADVKPLLLSVALRIVQETTSPVYPNHLSGKYCDIVYLVELITYMGGVPLLASEELSRDQVDCLGAGPGLRVMMLMDQSRREELYRPGAMTAGSSLQEALLHKDIFRSLLFGLSKLRLEVQYDCQLLCQTKSLQLRSVAALTDEVQLALLQLINFVLLPEPNTQLTSTSDITALSLSPEKFARVLPPISDLVRFCEPAMVWHLVRSALPPIFSPPTESHKASKEDLSKPGLYPITEDHLKLLANSFYQESFPGLCDLYTIFWRLDLHDIWHPSETYQKQINFIARDLKQIATERRPPGNTHSVRRSVDDATVQKELDLMVFRLNQWKSTFETELTILQKHKEHVMETLRTRKHQWFQPQYAGPNALAQFLQYMIAPRLLHSQKDTLYCIKFVQLLVDLDAEGFYLMDFFNKWTGMLTPLVRSCSIQEADYLGLFFNDMTSIINQWIRDPSFLAQFTKENRQCYTGLITRKTVLKKEHSESTSSQESKAPADENERTVLESSELLKVIGKWENRIFRVIQHGLSLTEREASWMSQRIVIKFLNTTHTNFPITNIAGDQILRSLPALIERAKETRWDDVVANARALDRNLRLVESQWLKRKEEEDDEMKKHNVLPSVPSGVSDTARDKAEQKKRASAVTEPKSVQGSVPIGPAPASSAGSVASSCHNSIAPKGSTHSTAVAKGPRNPFQAPPSSSCTTSASRPGTAIAPEPSTPAEAPKRSIGTSVPLSSIPYVKRLKINQDTVEAPSQGKPLTTISFGESAASIDAKCTSTDGSGSDATKKSSADRGSVPSVPKDNIVEDRNTLAKACDHEDLSKREIREPASERQQDTDIARPCATDDGSVPTEPLDTTESEVHKFEKQKEIDALRQRMKSLHTYRSKSAPSDPLLTTKEDVNAKPHVASMGRPSVYESQSKDVRKKEQSGAANTPDERRDKASGWSDCSKKKQMVKGRGSAHSTIIFWGNPDGNEKSKCKSTARLTEETPHQNLPSSSSSEDVLKKKLNTTASSKESSESRWSLPPDHVYTHDTTEDVSHDASCSGGFARSHVYSGTSPRSHATNDVFPNDTSRVPSAHREENTYSNGRSRTRSRSLLGSRLPPPPPPPPPPVALLLPPILRQSDGQNSGGTKGSVPATHTNSHDFPDAKSDSVSSLTQKSMSPVLRDSQTRMGLSDISNRGEPHHKDQRYTSRSSLSKGNSDRSGRWRHEDYPPQQLSPHSWSETGHQRGTPGWYRHFASSSPPQWSYKRSNSNSQMLSRDNGRDRQASQPSVYHCGHRQRSSETGSASFSQQQDLLLLKNRQDGTSFERSTSRTDDGHRRRADDYDSKTYGYPYTSNDSHLSSRFPLHSTMAIPDHWKQRKHPMNFKPNH